MAKKPRHNPRQNAGSESSFITRAKNRVVAYGIIGAIVLAISIGGYKSMIPTNGNSPIFGIPVNHFIKAKYSARSGYCRTSMSSASSKGLRGSGGGGAGAATNPSYVFANGALQSVHVINEDYETHLKHNFNIDEFNVHSKDLGYSESQTITFVADRTGNFHYYFAIHPEMKGVITIQ